MKLFIEFTRPGGLALLSWLIRAIQKVPYSHTRLRWVNSQGVNIIYEASGATVKFVGPIAQKESNSIVIEAITIELDQEQKKKLIRLCVEYAGVKYGVAQLIGIGIARMFRMKRNPLSKGSKEQVCSELVGRIMVEVCGLEKPGDWDLAGPKEINKWLMSHLRLK